MANYRVRSAMLTPRAMLRTSCFVGVEMTLGDLICQSLEGATSFDTGRSAAVGAAGFTATAPVVHMCLVGLERTLPGNSASAVLGKVLRG